MLTRRNLLHAAAPGAVLVAYFSSDAAAWADGLGLA